MRILKNSNILERQADNYIKGELSNIASVLQTPQILVEWFSIDADSSTTMPGFNNIEDFIGPTSSVMYNLIDNVPISGIDNLLTQTQFDDELGHDVDFTTSGLAFPNTITPKPNDFFVIKGAQNIALYVITNATYTTVRSNPFTEISIRLASQEQSIIDQLRTQVKDNYETVVTAIGTDKTLVIKKSAYLDIQHHIEQYVDVLNMYVSLFYDRQRSAFVFDGLYDNTTKLRTIVVDITLWKFMFDNGIIIFDDVITYANNNMKDSVERVYVDCPDMYLTDNDYGKSVVARIYRKNKEKNFAEYRYPQLNEEDPQISKFMGAHTVYIEQYDNVDTSSDNLMCVDIQVFDDDFINYINTNTLYDENVDVSVNTSLRNAIIKYYNDQEIDFDNIAINDTKNMENYQLIPLLLGIYQSYISTLK